MTQQGTRGGWARASMAFSATVTPAGTARLLHHPGLGARLRHEVGGLVGVDKERFGDSLPTYNRPAHTPRPDSNDPTRYTKSCWSLRSSPESTHLTRKSLVDSSYSPSQSSPNPLRTRSKCRKRARNNTIRTTGALGWGPSSWRESYPSLSYPLSSSRRRQPPLCVSPPVVLRLGYAPLLIQYRSSQANLLAIH